MPNNSIKVITLEGCNRCKELKDLLAKEGINFHEIGCEDNPTFCDNLELISKQEVYPMIMIHHEGETFLIHTTDKNDELGQTIGSGKDYYRKPVLTVQNMVQTLKNIK